MISFVGSGEGTRESGAVIPQAVFVAIDGKAIALRGHDALAYCAAVNRVENQPSTVGDVSDVARGWLRKVTARLISHDPVAEAAIASARETHRFAVVAHDARTQCYIDDKLMGIMCFKRGSFALYCLVEDKFCQHDSLRHGLVESVAAILLEETALLEFSLAMTKGAVASFEQVERAVLYAYKNSAIHLWKTSPQLKHDESARSLYDIVDPLDRLRFAVNPLATEDRVSICMRISDTAWGFKECFGQREFIFAIPGSRGLSEAFSEAASVREHCLVGLHLE